jgi:glycosyltransferase involved in cell wall biosynthesis
VISILIPTYKRPHQLVEALRSLEDQDPALIHEILIGDDSPAVEAEANSRVIGQSLLAAKCRHIIHPKSLGNYPNQWALAEASKGQYILILHDDDRLLPGGLDRLAEQANQNTDSRVRIWFGRNRIIDEHGQVNLQQSQHEMAKFGKAGNSTTAPLWEFCLKQGIPPDCFLVERSLYVKHMRGPRDGNVGDFWCYVRMANDGEWGHFIALDISDYRVQSVSNTSAGRGTDVHYVLEAAKSLKVPGQAQAAKAFLVNESIVVGTRRYLRDGDKRRAWACYLQDWSLPQRLSLQGLTTACAFILPKTLIAYFTHTKPVSTASGR